MTTSYTRTSLDVSGYDGKVPVNLWSAESDTLLVMLPGVGYTNQMPLMFYLHELATARGWDILEVNYAYSHLPNWTSDDEMADRLRTDVRASIDAARTNRAYQYIVIAGKSLGTLAMHLLIDSGYDDASGWMWLTPLFRRPPVLASALKTGPAIAVWGDVDPTMGEVTAEQLQQAGFTTVVVPGADHGMMIDHDVPTSISELATVFTELDRWLDTVVPWERSATDER